MIALIIALILVCFYVLFQLKKARDYEKIRDTITYRVHVNGIRGKSTVTRYIAAIFRAKGLRTYGKTTGTAARVIQPNGEDFDFKRKGYADVNEQVTMMTNFGQDGAQAVVMECMAINPDYSRWLEQKVMKSHIGVITNVREDHQDQLGHTLPDIARSLSNTIPEEGILITSEREPAQLAVIQEEAQRRNTQVIVAKSENVSDEAKAAFPYLAIKDNIAVGLEVAQLIDLPQDDALKAMIEANPDEGAFYVERLEFEGKTLYWANLFAVNDKESFIFLMHELFPNYPKAEKIVILNNRKDRPERVELFTNIVAHDVLFDLVVTFGEYESLVSAGLDKAQRSYLNLGNTSTFKHASGEELLRQIIKRTKSNEIFLVGTVNIHTIQAEHLLHFLKEHKSHV